MKNFALKIINDYSMTTDVGLIYLFIFFVYKNLQKLENYGMTYITFVLGLKPNQKVDSPLLSTQPVKATADAL